MIGCINMDLPEIKLLHKLSGLGETEFKYFLYDYMNQHNGNLPKLDEIPYVDSVDNIKEFLLLDEHNGVSTEDLLTKTGTTNHIDALLKLNKLYTDKQIRILPLSTASILEISSRPTDNGELREDFEHIDNVNNADYFNDLVYRLGQMFGIKFHLITSRDPIFLKIPRAIVAKSFIYNGDVYLNTDNATVDDPTHEFMHILMGSLKIESPELYLEAVKLILDIPDYKAYALQYHDRTASDIAEEIFVKEVSKAFTNQKSAIDTLPLELKYQINRTIINTLNLLLDGDINVGLIPDVFLYPLKTVANIVLSKSMETKDHLRLNLHSSMTHRQLNNAKSKLMREGKLIETKTDKGLQYTLNGRVFSSEDILNDFILEKGDYFDKYGDIVFDYSGPSLFAQDLLNRASIDALKVKNEGISGYTIYGEEEMEKLYKEPYYGVTRFLSETFSEIEGKRLFPEFIEENYWALRREEWAAGNFTDSEKECFFDNDTVKEAQYTQMIMNEGKELAVSKKLLELMTNKWKLLAALGSEIHTFMQLFFSSLERADDYSYFRSKISNTYINENLLKDLMLYAKSLHTDLIGKFGLWGDLKFYTEFDIAHKIAKEVKGKEASLRGIIDLLVVDGRGLVHIVDYKVSTKAYNEFIDAKKIAFTYLLATYSKMLEAYGFNMRDFLVQLIAPILVLNFKKDKNKTWTDVNGNVGQKWTFDNFKFLELLDLTNDIMTKFSIYDNLLSILPTFSEFILKPNELRQHMSKGIKLWFTNYGRELKTDEELREELKENNALTPNDNGQLVFKPQNSNMKPIVVDIKNNDVLKAEETLFKRVKEYYAGFPEKRANFTLQTINALRKSLNNPNIKTDLYESTKTEDGTGYTKWFLDVFARYILNNEDYTILNLTNQNMLALTDLGFIVILNNHTNQIDWIRISTQPWLHKRFRFKDSDNMSMIGLFENDIKELQRNDSLMTMATYGNIELMETMLAINNMVASFEENSNTVIGRVLIANPIMNIGDSMSNEELLYTYKLLQRVSPLEGDNILQEGSPIKFANRWTLLLNELREILHSDNKRFSMFESALPELEAANDTADRVEALQKFIASLRKAGIHMNTTKELLQKEEVRLYNAAMLALAEAKNVKFRQQIEKYSGWLQNVRIWEKGLNSLELDNPGHMNNETLNLLAKLTMEMYQNTRDDVQEFKPLLNKYVEALKKFKGFSTVRALTIGNLARDLYKNMFRTDVGDNLVLKNPWDTNSKLDSAEREFLKFFLMEINKDRLYSRQAQFEKMKLDSDCEFFWLPLSKGDLASNKAATGDDVVDDLINSVKNFIKHLNPVYTAKQIKREIGRINDRLLDLNNRPQISDEEFFLMTNTFEKGHTSLDERLEYIRHPKGIKSDTGSEYFERNLETLLLKHKCAYVTKEHVDENTPLIKAALIHLSSMGAEQGTQYEKEMKYIRDYFKNKIKGEPLADPKWLVFNEMLAKLRESASLMTLGVAPVQFFYQLIDGMWKDISLMIRTPDVTGNGQTTAFTFENMLDSAKSAFSDLLHVGTPTIASLINELYGLNDMDMNIYYDRIKSDKFGLYNWRSLAFWSASRPDFFNRLTIFGSLMRHDGTWEAHKIVDGKLVYDFEQDKRFNLLTHNGDPNSLEYKIQMGRYLAMALLFEKEGATIYDKKLNRYVKFKAPKGNEIIALPKAYTNLQAESMKSLCDNIYGFYAHERKSMIHATTIGALWMQYRTYWSGKKNLYFESGGIKLKGEWVQATDHQGNKLFNYIDNGEVKTVTEDKLPAGVKALPAFKWKGTWEEGIALTVTKLMLEIKTNKAFMPAWEKLMSDEDFGRIYKSNLLLLMFDTIMFAVVGNTMHAVFDGWRKQLKLEMDDSFTDALALNAFNVLARSLENSFLDFNYFESIGLPAVSWDPFAFTYGIRQIQNLYKLASGDETLLQMWIKASGAANQNKDIINWIDLNLLHGGDKTEMPLYKKRHPEYNDVLDNTLHIIAHPVQSTVSAFAEAARNGMKFL